MNTFHIKKRHTNSSRIYTKSILINYAGYPASPRMLVPDNGLASIAGSLISRGHKTIIFDYATVEVIKKIFPYELKDELGSVTKEIIHKINNGESPGIEQLKQFHKISEKIEYLESKNVGRIADELCAYIKNNPVDFVGFKLWAGDGFDGSIKMAKRIKSEFPKIKIIAGGPHVDWFKEKIAENCPEFDILVYADGEEAILCLADYVLGNRELSGIVNVIYRDGNKIITNPKNMIKNINGLAFPEYSEDVYPAMKGNNKLKIIMIDDSRGCSNGCNFCLHPMKSGYIQRLRNPEGVVDEMERCKKLYGISVFKFAGSNTPKKLALGIAHEITKRNLRVKYTAFANARADITVGEFEALKNSGCFGLWFGVESGNQKILDNVMNKKITIGRLLEKMLNCKKAGIYASGSVIVPAPGETEKTKEDTLKFLVRSGIDSVIVEPAIIIPGTKWDTDSEKYNIEIMDRDKFFKEEMFYKMKLLYPPDLLKPCPYFKINGKLDKEIFKEAGNFVKRLEKNGIITQITVDTALIAQYAGLGTKEFRDQSRIYFINGDHNKIKQQVSYINSKLLN